MSPIPPVHDMVWIGNTKVSLFSKPVTFSDGSRMLKISMDVSFREHKKLSGHLLYSEGPTLLLCSTKTRLKIDLALLSFWRVPHCRVWKEHNIMWEINHSYSVLSYTEVSISWDAASVLRYEGATFHALNNIFCILGQQVNVVMQPIILKGLVCRTLYSTKATNSPVCCLRLYLIQEDFIVQVCGPISEVANLLAHTSIERWV